MNDALLSAALRYAAADVAVFPARLYVRGDGKKGVAPIADWDSASSTDPAVIREWFTGAWSDAALCIDCGKSGIVGVDQDVTEGKQGPANWAALDPPATYRVRSPTGGAHDYYRADPAHPFTVDNSGAVADGVDIRGTGGFLFAPPSVDPRGGAWQWVEGEPDWPALPMVPEVVVKRMEAAAGGKRAKAPARLDPSERQDGLSQLFTGGTSYGPGGGLKKESKARALLTARLEEFLGRTQEGTARSHFLAQDLGVLAGHGVGVFWSYEAAHETLMEAARENGMVAVHSERYVADQARRGLEYGMRELWVPEAESAPIPLTEESEPSPDSWAPVDVSAVLNGEHRQVVPELGRRSDGIRILYPGKEHAIASEPECGKTWWVMLQVKDVLEEGGRVVYIDFEDDEGTIVGRLMSLGIDHALLRQDTFRYVRPDLAPPAGAVARLCTFGSERAALVVLDGMTEGLGLMGLSALDQEAIVEWRKVLVKPAMRLGAATLTTDHVVKASEARGRYAIGAQHKLAGLNGVMFTMTAYKPFGQGLDGISSVYITKDRNGGLRRQGKQAEGITEIGALHGVCSAGRNEWSFRPPFDRDSEKRSADRYPGLDAKYHNLVKPVLEYIKANQNHSYTTIRNNVKANKASTGIVLHWLADKQAVATQPGPGGGRLYALDAFIAATVDVEQAVLDGVRDGSFPT